MFNSLIALLFPPPIYGRLKTDQQVWGKMREVGLSNPPATVPFNNMPRVSKETVKLSMAFLAFVKKINGTIVFKKLMIPQAGWLNNAYREGQVQPVQAIGFAGNVKQIEKIVKGKDKRMYGRVKAQSFSGIPAEITFESNPELIDYFTTSKRNGWLGKLGKGFDAFILTIKRTELWVDMDRVELFPELPMEVSIITPSLHIRSEPAKTTVVGGLIGGDIATIKEYACRGRNVWAHIKEGWICLQDVTPGRIQIFTTWRMATPPPPM